MSKRKSQSIMEYAMLVGVVAAALAAIMFYVQSAMNTRLAQVREELHESLRGQVEDRAGR